MYTVQANNAIVGGNGNYIGQKTAASDSTVNLSSYAYNTASSNQWNDIAFHANYPNKGFIVGANKAANQLTLNTSGVISAVTAITAPAGTFNFNALHVFRDNTFMAVGTAGNAQFYTGSAWLDQSPASYSQATFNDVFFHDDRTGYLAGDSINTGTLLKCVSPVNLQTLTTAGTISWNRETLTDGFNITANANVNPLKVVAFSSRYTGFVAGNYANGFTNNSSYPYARLLRDEADMFSTFYYYDKLGRMVVSQNTKQFNKSPLAYSYTLYDALGRITEVGEKTENTNGHRFKNIFGATVNGVFNPKVINDDSLTTWLSDNTGARKEVTHTYYDTIQYTALPFAQQNLRKRVASTTFEDMDDSNPSTYNHATHFSYDIHGNVNTLIQDNPVLGTIESTQRYKHIEYEYDLVSGNVNKVKYQQGQADQFYHKYAYDADNRLTQVWSSKSNPELIKGWDSEAKYFYYNHGPLARVELGDNQVQGVDYAYNLQGWIKAINSNVLKDSTDIGHDGMPGTVNQKFAKDAFGYSLNYYNGDYLPIGTLASLDSAIATLAGSDILKARHDLFNGNISSMVTTITKPTVYTATTGTPTVLPQATAYKYDQLNRLVEMQAYNNLNTTTNAWGYAGTYNGMYHNKFMYDANGNITAQLRKDSAGVAINNLVYRRYNVNGKTLQNRLYMVNDSVATGTFTDDIDDQGTFDNTNLASVEANNNYRYDEIGSLNHNTQKEIDTIKYSVYGKVKEVIRTSGSTKKNLKFDYDANQNRIAKHIYTSAGVLEKSEYYVRDAQGNVMSIYKVTDSDIMQTEKHLYGSTLLGIDKQAKSMIGAMPDSLIDTLNRYLGYKNYALNNHLGNSLVIITDKKIPRLANDTVNHFVAEVASATDYYPFGVAMKERTFSDTNYRYKFNGKEFDSETETSDFGARNFDGDIGGGGVIDLLAKSFAFNSPYSYAENRPIDGIDLDGKEWTSTKDYDPTTRITTIKNTVKLQVYNNTSIKNNSKEMQDLISDTQAEFKNTYTQFDKSTNTQYTAELIIEFAKEGDVPTGFSATLGIVDQQANKSYVTGDTPPEGLGQTQKNSLKIALEVKKLDNTIINLLTYNNGSEKTSVIRTFLHELGHTLGLDHPENKQDNATKSIQKQYKQGKIDDNLMIQDIENQIKDRPQGSKLENEQLEQGSQTIQKQQPQ